MNGFDRNKKSLIKQNGNSYTYTNRNDEKKKQNSVYVSVNHIQKDYRKGFSNNYNDKLPKVKEYKCLFVTTPEKLLLFLFLLILNLCNKRNLVGKSSLFFPKQIVPKR
ncbi:hypothetical protein SH2C18_29460 [Clostridium sediminicola]